MEKRLAIIIPAFKPDFLNQALQSIESQTRLDFQVYIGDDASPADLWSIAKPFVDRNGWVYKKFETNLGGTDLISHWKRCVDFSSEPWIWLFSDDDVMGPECVETFMERLDTHPSHFVFRFPFSIIDKNSKETEVPPIMEVKELSGFDFGKARFERKLLSSAVEFIFSREAYLRNGGFVQFPLAWCSDDASWMAFSEPGKIENLSRGKVFWRLSDNNISSKAGSYTFSKLMAAVSFIHWFNDRYKEKIDPTLLGEQIIWFRLQLEQISFEPGILEAIQWTMRLRPKGTITFLRTLNEVYARSFCSNRKKRGQSYEGFRYWLSGILPKY
jgi:GT2 family glycosyltransferase